MKNRGTTALIALFFLGLAGLWAADYWQVPSAAERARQRGRVLVAMADVKPDDLQKIEIEGGANPLVFERRGGRSWQMTAPLDVAADPSLVEGLAFRLKELTRKPQADTLTGDLKKYGLAPPARTIRLWGQKTDAPLATIDLGAVSFDRRYVRAGTDGAGVEVVPAQGLDVVDLPPVRWRDHELFRVPTFEVNAVRITTPDRDLKLERGPDAWRVVAPIRTLAVDAKVEGLIASLGSLRVTDDAQYVANEVGGTYWERYGLTKPSLTITVAAGRGPNPRPDQILRVGKPVEGQPDRLYAQIGDQNDLIAVDARILDELQKLEPGQLRSDKVADINPNRATRFRVEAGIGGESFEIVRTGNDWFVTRPSLGRADSKAVQEFFQTLEGLRTGLILPPSPAAQQVAGVDRPGEIIKVWQAPNPGARTDPDAKLSEGPTFTLKIGNRDAGKKVLYAQVEGDPAVLALPDTVASTLFKNSWAFRDRLILTAPTEQIEQIRFEGLGKSVTIQAPPVKFTLFKNTPTGWWLSEPVTAMADDAAVSKLLRLLAALRVDGYAAEGSSNLAPFGLDAPTLKVTWSVPPVTPPSPIPRPPLTNPDGRTLRFDEQTLIVGGLVPDRKSMRYAMIVGHPLIFMLGGETLATLDGEWHDHRVLRFDPALVEKIHLSWPGTDWSFALNRTERDWAITGPVDIPGFDAGATGTVLKAAAELATPRYSQYRGATPQTLGLTPPRLVVRFSGSKLPGAEELQIGGALENGQSYASAPLAQPGAVFLIGNAPFVPWLRLQPPIKDNLPDNVFLEEPADAPGPGLAPGPQD